MPVNKSNFYLIAEDKSKLRKGKRNEINIIKPEAIFEGVLKQKLNFEKYLQ